MAADPAEQIIQHLQLQPHPEGGYYKEIYRSNLSIPESALPEGFEGARNCCTGIYFMLTADTFSAFHRIKQDEIWHFYQGTTIELHMISPKGEHTLVKVGHDFINGEVPQAVVPAGYWFAAEVVGGEFALVGCTVSPGFDFQDFELADREGLTSFFLKHEELIRRFTR